MLRLGFMEYGFIWPEMPYVQRRLCSSRRPLFRGTHITRSAILAGLQYDCAVRIVLFTIRSYRFFFLAYEPV